MFELIRTYQLDVMLFLSATSATMTVLLFITQFLPRRRKNILIGMEIVATLLLSFDRLAYIYAGNVSPVGYVMVRLSNFMVFFLTAAIVFCFNLYLTDVLSSKNPAASDSNRLRFSGIAAVIGMLLSVVTVFTGLYYTFDSQNYYHRSSGFLIAYIIPVLCPVVQFTVVHKYRKDFSRFIYTALILYIFVPIAVGIIQIFTYGLSIVNMSMVVVSVSLYIFNYLDINSEMQRVHDIEVEALKEEHQRMKQVFSQTASAFVNALELRSSFLKGSAERTADIARTIAREAGKTEDECDLVYYTALLHNAGIESLPDELIGKEEQFTKEEEQLLKNLPVVSATLLSKITAFPFLEKNVRAVCERYDGTGYPEKLRGESIPEIARIVAVAKEYVSLTSQTKTRKAFPPAIVREEFVKEAGSRFDPNFATILVHQLDTHSGEVTSSRAEPLENALSCGTYRQTVSAGVPVLQTFTNIRFSAVDEAGENEFSAPSIIVFDSFDRRVHNSQKSIDAYHYLEYGEIWFDGHIISTSARNMEVHVTKKEPPAEDSGYTVSAARYEDHLLIKTDCASASSEVIVALPDSAKAAYIALTGEHCQLCDIIASASGQVLSKDDVPRIAEEVSYINHIESDIPNVQINSPRAEYTEGIAVKNRVKLHFHTMSLPEANLVWHCPYIVLYYAEDGVAGGKGYREYACIKLNGEDNGSNAFAKNSFHMRRTDAFESWNAWKEANKAGFECRVEIERKGKYIELSTENLGISIENTTEILEPKDAVYAALTGDLCAITDIRLR
ncbi:MAG: diguanylate cyclase [Treponema sp.]|nr:diguanylate cyclase [Treponema sp.]